MMLLSDKFMTVDNFWNVMRQISVNVCISVGMTLVILTGGIDLSVGSILAFCGAVSAGLYKNGIQVPEFDLFIGFTLFGAILVGTGAGALLGGFNGIMITRFKVPPICGDPGNATMARGLTMLWTGGFPITGLGDSFTFFGTGWLLGIPMPVWISAIIVILAGVLAVRTRLGRHIYAVGGNEKASILSGLNVKKS